MSKKYIHEDYQHCVEEFLESVLNTMGEAVIVANAKGKIIMVNRHVQEVWGYAPQILLNKNITHLMPEEYRKAHRAGMAHYIKTGEQKILGKRLELEGRRNDGAVFPIQIFISETVLNGERFFTAVVRDISQIKQQQDEFERTHEFLLASSKQIEQENANLIRQIQLDPMTRVLNHIALKDRLDGELDRLTRTPSELSLLFVDIDDFKKLNDQYGHLYGDECLVELADLLVNVISRSVDIVGRYGGEEFVLILPNTSSDGAMAIAERLRSVVESHDWRGKPITVTVGVATTNRKIDGDTLINHADKAMYYGKQSGKNQVNRWGPRDDSESLSQSN